MLLSDYGTLASYRGGTHKVWDLVGGKQWVLFGESETYNWGDETWESAVMSSQVLLLGQHSIVQRVGSYKKFLDTKYRD